MLLRIAAFELKKRFGYLSTYIYFALFFAIAFLTTIAVGGAFQGVAVGMGSDKVLANSPFVLNGTITLTSYFGLLITAALFGRAVCQDFENNSWPLFFSAPVKKSSYLGGRFLGALALTLFIYSSLGLGAWVGSV